MRNLILAAVVTAASASSSLALAKQDDKDKTPAPAAMIPVPIIVDATGKTVGVYQAPFYAVMKYSGAAITIGIQRGGPNLLIHSAKLQYSDQESYHAAADCSGPAIPSAQSFVYTNAGFSGLTGTRPVGYVKSAGGQVTAYIAAVGIATLRSFGSVHLTDGRCIVAQNGSLMYGYDVETTVILPPAPLTVQ